MVRKGVVSHSIYGGGRVDENRVLAAALPALVEGAEGLVVEKGLGVENHFVGAKVVAASGQPLPLRGPSKTGLSCPRAVLS